MARSQWRGTRKAPLAIRVGPPSQLENSSWMATLRGLHSQPMWGPVNSSTTSVPTSSDDSYEDDEREANGVADYGDEDYSDDDEDDEPAFDLGWRPEYEEFLNQKHAWDSLDKNEARARFRDLSQKFPSKMKIWMRWASFVRLSISCCYLYPRLHL